MFDSAILVDWRAHQTNSLRDLRKSLRAKEKRPQGRSTTSPIRATTVGRIASGRRPGPVATFITAILGLLPLSRHLLAATPEVELRQATLFPPPVDRLRRGVAVGPDATRDLFDEQRGVGGGPSLVDEALDLVRFLLVRQLASDINGDLCPLVLDIMDTVLAEDMGQELRPERQTQPATFRLRIALLSDRDATTGQHLDDPA